MSENGNQETPQHRESFFDFVVNLFRDAWEALIGIFTPRKTVRISRKPYTPPRMHSSVVVSRPEMVALPRKIDAPHYMAVVAHPYQAGEIISGMEVPWFMVGDSINCDPGEYQIQLVDMRIHTDELLRIVTDTKDGPRVRMDVNVVWRVVDPPMVTQLTNPRESYLELIRSLILEYVRTTTGAVEKVSTETGGVHITSQTVLDYVQDHLEGKADTGPMSTTRQSISQADTMPSFISKAKAPRAISLVDLWITEVVLWEGPFPNEDERGRAGRGLDHTERQAAG